MGINNMALQVNESVAEMDKEFIQRSNHGVLYLHDLKQKQKVKMQKDFLDSLTSDIL